VKLLTYPILANFLTFAVVKTVHKDNQLDLVGWYTLMPKTGPTSTVLPIHNQFLSNYNESAVLLCFHPTEVEGHSVGGRLPVTIYESNFEVDDPKTDQDGEDKKMEDGESNLKLKFKELPYSVETDETEMISMDFVASGGGNATAVAAKEKRPSVVLETDIKGKKRAVAQEASELVEEPAELVLSREQDEMIASLTAKANAIKMLHSRIQLITKYLERLPSSYLNNGTQSSTETETDGGFSFTTPSHTILRQIQALVSRMDLVVPSDEESFQKEILCEQNDVNLISLLNDVMQSLNDAREVGKKFSVVESSKNQKRSAAADYPSGAGLTFSLPGAGDLLV
jgi:COP9 signalosome complex subunit 6